MVKTSEIPASIASLKREQKQIHFRLSLVREDVNYEKIEKSKFFNAKNENDPNGVKYIFTSDPSSNIALLDKNTNVFEMLINDDGIFDESIFEKAKEIYSTFYSSNKLNSGMNFICFRFAPNISDFEQWYSAIYYPLSIVQKPTFNFQSGMCMGSYTKPNKPFVFELVHKLSPQHFVLEFYCGVNLENQVEDSLISEMHRELVPEVFNLFEKHPKDN